MRNFHSALVAPVLLAAAGDLARGMANAPKGNAPASPEPTAKVNRFDKLFTGVIFKSSDSDKVYTNDRSGVRSKKLATVLVELAGTGGYVRGSVYAKQGKDQQRAVAEFTFMGAQMQTCIVAEDSAAKTELNEFRARVANDYVKWAQATGSTPTVSVNVGAALELSI